MPDTYLLPDEAAAVLRVAPKTLTKWRWLGKGPPYRKVAGNLIRYVQSELEAWMGTQAVLPAVDAPGDDLPPPPTPRAAVHALPPRPRLEARGRRRASRAKY